MTTYLIPGEMPEAVREHFRQRAVNSRERTVTIPAQITGYTVPEEEIHCSVFQQAAGLNENFIAQNSHPTNTDGLTLIWDGRANRTHQVLYQEGSARVQKILERLAQEFNTDLATTRANDCFSGGRFDGCDPHSVGDHQRLVNPIYVHFNCAQRGNRNRREGLTQLYDFSLKNERGLAPQVRANPLQPAGGVVINDSNGQPVAEVDGDVIYILVNIDASEEQDIGYQWVNSYWTHNAEVLERILREAIPIAISQEKKARIDPIERQRERLAGQQEDAINQFLNRSSTPAADLIRNMETQIERQEQHARANLQDFLAAQRELDQLHIQVGLLRENPHPQDEELRQQIENILAMPHVIGISFGDSLEVYTDTIYIEHQEVVRRIGAFKIQIDFKSGVNIFNYANPVRGEKQHPHVFKRGEPCFGNIAEAVTQMLRERQLEMLVTILLEYLQSFNPGYQLAYIDPWPVVAREEIDAV